MTKLHAIMLASLLSIVPAYASAEVSIGELADEMLEEDSVVLDGESSVVAQPGPPHGGRRVVHHQTTVVRRGPTRTVYAPAPRRVYVRQVQPVVVTQPTTVVVDNSSNREAEEVTPKKVGSKFGLGIRGVGFVPGPAQFELGGELKSQVAGGVGWYIKYRPIRWVSVEFVNDILFGSYKNVDYYKDYIRVPLSLGLQVHVFDYGSLDVYGVAAASVAFMTVSDGNDAIDQELRYPQFGGQLGAGISLIAGGCEIGLDFRYTIEEAPDEYDGLSNPQIDQSKPVHGFLFSFNLGFAI